MFDVAEEVQVAGYGWDLVGRRCVEVTPRVHPDRAVADAAAMVRSAAAGGARRHRCDPLDARDAVLAFADEIGALVATTMESKGLFDGDPWTRQGSPGLSSDPVMELFAEADLVISFGASLNGYTLAKATCSPRRVHPIDIAGPLDAQRAGRRVLRARRRLRRGRGAASTCRRRWRGGHRYRTADVAARLQSVDIDPVAIEAGPDQLDPPGVPRSTGCCPPSAASPPACQGISGRSPHCT